MTKQRGYDLDRGAITQPPGRGTVPEPVRTETDPGPGPQPQNQVIGRLIGPRVALRLRPDVDEDMAAVGAAVLLVQGVGIQPDQLRPDGDRPAAGLSPRPVRVLPRHDADLLLRGGDVLVAEAQGFSRAAAALLKKGEEEACPQPSARIQDCLRLGGVQDPRQLLRRLQRDRPAAIRLPLADVVQARLPPPPPPGPPPRPPVP